MRKLNKTAPVTLQDLQKLVEKLKDKNPTGKEFLVEWGGDLFLDALEETIGEEEELTEAEQAKRLADPEAMLPELLPVTEEGVMRFVAEELSAAYEDPDELFSDLTDLSELLYMIAGLSYNRESSPENWDFPDSVKEDFIDYFDGFISGGYAEEPALTLFTTFVRDMAEEGNETALRILGYHSYGGSPAFPCDWEQSKECFDRLFEETGEPLYANTLGYLAYYGRCGDGVPDYDAAFRYFSYASASGIIESSYKLADMYAGGKGIWRNEEAAFRIIQELYAETLRRFCGGELTGKFADVALRMGRLYENGSLDEPNPQAAYYYYLQARYAIRFRRKLANQYGDDAVEKNIENAIARVEPEVPQESRKTCRRDYPWILQMALAMDKVVFVTFKQLKSGSVKMVLDRYEENEDDLHDFLVTLPEFGFCSMMETVTLTTGAAKNVYLSETEEPVLITSAVYDADNEAWLFLHGDEIAASFRTAGFSMKVSK